MPHAVVPYPFPVTVFPLAHRLWTLAEMAAFGVVVWWLVFVRRGR